MARSGEGVSLFPRGLLCTEKGFKITVWSSAVHFLLHVHCEVRVSSASFLISILAAQSPTKVVLNSSIVSLFR